MHPDTSAPPRSPTFSTRCADADQHSCHVQPPGFASRARRPDLAAVEADVRRAQLGFNTSRSTAELWTINSNRRVEPTIKIDTSLASLAANRDGTRIAVGTDDGIMVYDGFSGVERGRIRGSTLRGAVITPADQLFVSSLGAS